jgi:hypothetical protein
MNSITCNLFIKRIAIRALDYSGILHVTDHSCFVKMSDAESEISTNCSNGQSPIDLPRRPARSQRIDYHLLNGGSDEEAGPDNRATKKPRLNPPCARSESIGPDDSASQWPQDLPTPSQSLPLSRTDSEALQSTDTFKQSHVKTHNQWLWNQFSVSSCPGKLWQPKQSKCLLEDQEIQYTQYD